METTLHRQLKAMYAPTAEATEVRLGRWRIDAVRQEELIEVQLGPLAAIGRKTQQLLREHRLRVVKPLVLRWHLVRLGRKGGRELSRRWSPKQGRLWHVFQELVHFMRVFPHDHLQLELLGVHVRQWRYPSSARRRWGRRGYAVQDVELLSVEKRVLLHRGTDLWQLLPEQVPDPFDTAQLAQVLDAPRWQAQQVAYCLRRAGAVRVLGKRGNALVYSRPKDKQAA